MNVSIKWLKEYVDFDLSPEALSERLLMLGMEIESIKRLGEGLDRVVVGRINTVDKHPQADKLVLCNVDVGIGYRHPNRLWCPKCTRRVSCPCRTRRCTVAQRIND